MPGKFDPLEYPYMVVVYNPATNQTYIEYHSTRANAENSTKKWVEFGVVTPLMYTIHQEVAGVNPEARGE